MRKNRSVKKIIKREVKEAKVEKSSRKENPKPQWNSLQNNLEQYKLSEAELVIFF